MIRLQPITTADSTLYDYMERLLTASFPPEEYRTQEALRDYTDNKSAFCNQVILHDETPIGLLTYWDFGRFCYIEHFAIDPTLRNGGYGRQALLQFRQQVQRPIVLEAEEPVEEIARRRIRFYQRLDFQLWKQPYRQPPYNLGDAFLPMRLMAYGDLLGERDYEQVKQTIYREVYGVNNH